MSLGSTPLGSRPRERLHHLLSEEMPQLVWAADALGQWRYVNRRWVEYSGVDEARLLGLEWVNVLHPDDRGPTLERWRRSWQGGEPYEMEYRICGRDGAYRWFVTRGVTTGEGEDFDTWVGTCTDVEDLKRAEAEAEGAREASLRALGLLLEARDGETRGHTDRVVAFALTLGRALGLDEETLRSLRWGAYLHDAGKVAVPDAVLLKPGPLDEGEWAFMRGHVEAGHRFAAGLGFVPPAALEVVLRHHERWDGSGYPSGLRGRAIPLLARLFAVCDVYDALTSERPYKQAWSREAALAEVEAGAGRQLDPELARLFVDLERRQPEA